MTFRANRKVTPKVVNGKTQKKHRHDPSPSVWTSAAFQFEKERPGAGFFHAISKKDLIKFFEIIPNWDVLSEGLKGVRLEQGVSGYDGLYFHAGLICIPAWERELWRDVNHRFFLEHRNLFDRIGLAYEQSGECWTLKHTLETIRAYQLLHIFLHELGHHVDRMTSRRKENCGRGEPFAEGWAFEFERKVWDDYQDVFGVL